MIQGIGPGTHCRSRDSLQGFWAQGLAVQGRRFRNPKNDGRGRPLTCGDVRVHQGPKKPPWFATTDTIISAVMPRM